jgi:XisH protein
MPARDKIHTAVCNAIRKDGWTITNDPLHLRYAEENLYVDIAAERVLAAERGNEKIAIEVKTFGGLSDMKDLHDAVGQFIVYREVLSEIDPERTLYLGVTESTRRDIFDAGLGALLLTRQIHCLVSVDTENEEIIEWIKS